MLPLLYVVFDLKVIMCKVPPTVPFNLSPIFVYFFEVFNTEIINDLIL